MEPPKIPESVLKEISLYMSAGEKVIDALASASGPVGKLGELWMILSDQTVFFHTKEYGKDPVVALISRKDLKVVKYDQHATGTTLTFVPASHPKNTIKVPFPKIQRPQVNRFCEELSKSIPFELVGKQERPSIEAPQESPEKEPKPASPSSTPISIENTGQTPAMNPGSGVKIVKTASPKPPVVEKTTPVEKPILQETTAADLVFDPPDATFVLAATAISVLVGFLWYYLFKSIFDSK